MHIKFLILSYKYFYGSYGIMNSFFLTLLKGEFQKPGYILRGNIIGNFILIVIPIYVYLKYQLSLVSNCIKEAG